MPKSFVGPAQRDTALRYVRECDLGLMMTLSEPTKKRIQEEKYHAQIDDIAEQTTYAGKSWHREDMKRILIDGSMLMVS